MGLITHAFPMWNITFVLCKYQRICQHIFEFLYIETRRRKYGRVNEGVKENPQMYRG